jgi:6-phosphogluconolactonase/glucosamine-6-phosphate isomerase/deaminase
MNISFIKIKSTDPVAGYLADTLKAHLAKGERVLWLVPGGSAIQIAAAVSTQLRGHSLKNLAVTLTDERYGPVGHPDSNWHQLEQAGFSLPGAELMPVLSGADMEATTANFAATLERELARADYRLGFFGIGPDGHTAGMLPDSPAVTAQGFASGYSANYERITMTVPAIRRLDEAVVYAVGENKWPVLDQLEGQVELTKQPAQALKPVSKLTIFNDYKGVQA